MPVASFGSGWQQRGHPLPQIVRNKISMHPDTLPTKIVERKTRSSTHSETISYWHFHVAREHERHYPAPDRRDRTLTVTRSRHSTAPCLQVALP